MAAWSDSGPELSAATGSTTPPTPAAAANAVARPAVNSPSLTGVFMGVSSVAPRGAVGPGVRPRDLWPHARCVLRDGELVARLGDGFGDGRLRQARARDDAHDRRAAGDQ